MRSDTGLHERYGKTMKVVNATGGGAYKYSDFVKNTLGITFNQQVACLLHFL